MGNRFERNSGFQLSIFNLIDLSHPALRDKANDLVSLAHDIPCRKYGRGVRSLRQDTTAGLGIEDRRRLFSIVEKLLHLDSEGGIPSTRFGEKIHPPLHGNFEDAVEDGFCPAPPLRLHHLRNLTVFL
jgi:hypothetical protein